MRNSKNHLKWLVLTLVLAAVTAYTGIARDLTRGAQTDETFRVRKIIDGDTIRVTDKKGRSRLLRYEGIDCPEKGRDDSPGDPFSKEATELNSKLVKNKTVRVRFGTEKYDRYGRLLGFVFTDGENVNREIVSAGLATVLKIGKQNPEMMEELTNAQQSAMKKRIGLWSGDGNFEPSEQNNRFAVPQNKMAEMEGQRIVVRAKIMDAMKKSGGIIILKTDGGVEVVIFGSSVENFRHFGINPLEYYNNKNVLITGRASMYRGRPNIIIRHPFSIHLEG